ncbi:winged helix-turn-helix transcriptional regulator [Oceanibacterium hippocampi]|uniref:HTH-type transcriptional regulator YodB n=1 Tax=Oceanibacterium hippocampi TaxID=745714 RepID=A0A1Y5TQU2_9PROT|nr:helix-turn-helix domain-containing protein [Oceanibacterium hippocampi]SLN69383.1 HTH-type transcriptional regulator YodB [Oceanibacterium hippocampi]
MTARNYAQHRCPIAQSLSIVGDQWTLLIIRDALNGKRRFGEFLDSLGLSRNLLTNRLAEMVEMGLLERVALPGTQREGYAPTAKCRDLQRTLLSLAAWGDRWLPAPEGRRVVTRERGSGRPVSLRFCRDDDGIAIDDRALEVIRHSR